MYFLKVVKVSITRGVVFNIFDEFIVGVRIGKFNALVMYFL